MPLELVRDWVQEYRPSSLLRSPNEREFLPAALEIIERPASPAGRLTGMVICAAVVLALLWATIGKVNIIASAEGRIVPVGNTKVIQPEEMGTVKAILVADGDRVRKGETLLELDTAQTKADTIRYADQLVVAELDLAKNRALWSATQSAMPPKLEKIPPGASGAQILAARSAMEADFNANLANLADLRQQLTEKRAETSASLDGVQKAKATLPFVQEQADLRSDLVKLQFSNRLAYLQAQQALVEQKQQLLILADQSKQAAAQAAALSEKISEANSDYRKTLLDNLNKSESQVSELTAAKIKSDHLLLGKTLVAPIDGTVQQLAVHTVGGVVTPAQQLLTIVPNTGGLLVEARVQNRDIGFVHAGQSAEVKIETFNFTKYGLIEGTVASVSRDAVVTDDQGSAKKEPGATDAAGSLSPSYVAYIKLSKNWIDTETGRSIVSPGMAVTAEIATGRRRIIDYLLSPFQKRVSESVHER